MRLAIAFVIVALVVPAQAALLEIEIPDAIIGPSDEVCEDLRIASAARSITRKLCAEEFLRRGLREFWEEKKRTEATDAGRVLFLSTFDAGMATFDGAFPTPLDVMSCGDGTLDDDPTIPYLEECDDGNLTPGDGCDENCVIEVP